MKNTKEIGKGLFFNYIETNKFKTNVINFLFIRPLSKSEVTKNTLLSMVLSSASKKYKDKLEIARKLEELYGAKLNTGIMIRGDRQVISISLTFVDESYLSERGYIREILDFLDEIILRPSVENGEFSQEVLEREKINLSRRIKRKINDKREYAIDRTIENMFKGENFSIPSLGYIEDIDSITTEDLYLHYKNVLETSQIYIYFAGNKNERIENHYKNYKIINRENIINIKRENIHKKIDKVNYIKENMDVNQGKLVLGYRANIPYEDRLYSALLVGNVIFGASANSKLFLNVREKNSLAYYIVSRLYKYKSAIIVDAGIEFKNYSKTVDIITKELENMKSGNISKDEINIAKKFIISSLNSIEDNNYSLIEDEFEKNITNDYRNIEERIKDIESVSYKNIVRAFKKIELDTVYFMENKKMLEGKNES